MSSILIAVAGLSLLMVVHELGHFLAARVCGMRVTDFSIGIGPAIARFRPVGGATTYALRAIPFAAYVRIDGAVPPELEGAPAAVAAGQSDLGSQSPGSLPSATDAALYYNKSVFARIVVNAGGPIANYLAASVMIFGLALSGWPTAVTNSTQAGARAVERVPMSVADAATQALVLPARHTFRQLTALAEMVANRSSEGLTGPVGMGKIVAEQAERGTVALVMVLISLSIGLGMFNLLPLPGLDGGKLVFLGYEAITRRRPSARVEVFAHAGGLLIMLGLVAMVTMRDVFG